jgi:hypothetical protein
MFEGGKRHDALVWSVVETDFSREMAPRAS